MDEWPMPWKATATKHVIGIIEWNEKKGKEKKRNGGKRIRI